MTQGKLSWAWKRSKKRTSCHFDRGCSTPPTPLISPFASLASPIAPELPGSRLFRDSKGASWWNAEKCPYLQLRPLVGSELVANWKFPHQTTWCWQSMWQSSDVGKTVVAKSLTYSQPILQGFKHLVGFRFETFLQVADLSGNLHRFLPFHTLPDLFFMGWIDITKFKFNCWAMEELWAESHFRVEDARKSISVGLTGLRRAVKLLQANWNKLGNFHCSSSPAPQIAVNCIFWPIASLYWPGWKVLQLNVLVEEEATAGNAMIGL